MKPKLRALEITPVEHDGENYYHFNDRLGIANSAAVPRSWGSLLTFFDGQRTLEEIAAEHVRRYGEPVQLQVVQRVLDQMDEALLLDSPRFQTHYESLVREFENASTRPAVLAGSSYPAEPDKLHRQLDGYFKSAKTIETPALPANAKLRGIVVPHIDFHRGGVTEALAYEQLAAERFDTLLVFGIAHSGVQYPFCAAAKDYETPLGQAVCDREFLADLQNRVGDQMLAEQYAHRNEHSVEFVAVFLQHLQQFQSTQIVPFICGGFFEELRSGNSPQSTLIIAEFIKALREVVGEHEARGKRIGFVASVDLAHVGSRFGDESKLSPQRLSKIRYEDSKFLDAVASGDAESVHAALTKDNNARNVDAHPAVYTLLAAFPELRAQLLDYQQAFDEDGNSVVSFASMTLFS